MSEKMPADLEDDDEMAEEYDFSNAIPSPYPEMFRRRGHRVLDADVRDAFPDSEAVNSALRLLIKTAKAACAHESKAQEMQKAS